MQTVTRDSLTEMGGTLRDGVGRGADGAHVGNERSLCGHRQRGPQAGAEF